MSRLGTPTLYTIEPNVSFADALAAGLLARVSGDPLKLSELIVLLPNRRAVKSLREAFLRLNEGQVCLLPLMRPIGDVDEEEITFLGVGLNNDDTVFPPAISDMRRQLELQKLVARKAMLDSAAFGKTEAMSSAQSWRLAGELAQLMDQVETQSLTFDKLADLVPDNLSSHWQITLDFLTIVSSAWPKFLSEKGMMNPAVRRDKMLRHLASLWQETPPKADIIAAGSTGSIPAARELLSVVARLGRGSVVLPGLDRAMDEECWDAIDEVHPQFMLKELLSSMGVARGEVEEWHTGEDGLIFNGASDDRMEILREVMRPSNTTAEWLKLPKEKRDAAKVFKGLRLVTTATRREEATAIALMMRQALEEPGKTAALVTPDRVLARHVRAALTRFDIDIDDSAGMTGQETPAGTYLHLLIRAAEAGLAPVPLLALLKHPLVSAGGKRIKFLALVRRLDLYVLRGVRPKAGLEGIIIAAKAAKKISDDEVAWIEQALTPLDDLRQLLTDNESIALLDILEKHLNAAEALAGSKSEADAGDMAGETGASRLWAGDAGEALSLHFGKLIDDMRPHHTVPAADYPALFKEWLASVTVRPKWGRHPRLFIWGSIEARLQRADLMILGSLNEGTSPPEAKADPWMNRDMRREFGRPKKDKHASQDSHKHHHFGLPTPEQRVGQASHDFMQALGAADVIMTRAEKVDGTPTVPSRWLFRIKAVIGKLPGQGEPWRHWVDELDAAKEIKPVSPPAPKPPVEARPKKLAVTGVELLMRDPYALYAKSVLGLRALDPLDDKPSAADKGNIIHKALERFHAEQGARTGEAARERLVTIGKEVFKDVINQPTVYAFWWPRFMNIVDWFIEYEAERSEKFDVIGTEVEALHMVPGTDFTLRAFADRIDRNLASSAVEVIDYKTGAVPQIKDLKAGVAPQMPLEGWLASVNAFENIETAEVAGLSFWKVSGGTPPCEIKPVKDHDERISDSIDGLTALIKHFEKPGSAYLSRPRPEMAKYGDYDHLARVKEWRDKGSGA